MIDVDLLHSLTLIEVAGCFHDHAGGSVREGFMLLAHVELGDEGVNWRGQR